jgi:hypothetical protein
VPAKEPKAGNQQKCVQYSSSVLTKHLATHNQTRCVLSNLRALCGYTVDDLNTLFIRFIMDVKEFFELSAGKWFSQKTSHHLTLKQSEHGKSDLVIGILPREDPQVIQLCQQAGIDPSQMGVGAKYTWKGTMQWDAQSQNTANQQGAAIAILIPDALGSSVGKLFRSISGSETNPVAVRYTLGDDDALTLVTEDEHQRAEERVWFESNNVRLRTTIVTQSGGDAMASFYSEIRMGG